MNTAPIVPLTDEQRRLVETNRHLVLFAIRKFSMRPPPGQSGDDLLSECHWTLCRAAQEYDPSVGRFSTFATAKLRFVPHEMARAGHSRFVSDGIRRGDYDGGIEDLGKAQKSAYFAEIARRQTLSLESLAYLDGEPIEVGDAASDFADGLLSGIDLDRLLASARLTEIEKQTLRDIWQGYTKGETALRRGMTEGAGWLSFHHAIRKIRAQAIRSGWPEEAS